MASSRSSRGGSHVPRKSYGRFEFLVCDWSLMKCPPGENIVSQEFVMSDSSVWVLRIFPSGSSPRQAGFISVHVVMIGLGDNVDFVAATFNISVLGRKEMRQAHDPQLDKVYSLKSPSAMDFSLVSDATSTWAVDNFMLLNEIEGAFMDNNAILFALDIEVLGKPELLITTMPSYVGPLGTLADDFGVLFSDSSDPTFFSDITLVAGLKKLRCHKIVLAARSEVFRKKFQNASFHAKLLFNGGQYHLDDITQDVFEEMIRFIYTDSCSNDIMAVQDRGLLKAAVRFKLSRLIQMCEDHIGETLTPANVVDTLNLASDLRSERLDVCCSEFLSAHQNEVLATKTLGNLHPEALKDLIAKSILPASSVLLAGATVIIPSEGSNEEKKNPPLEEMKDVESAINESELLEGKLMTDADYIPLAMPDVEAKKENPPEPISM